MNAEEIKQFFVEFMEEKHAGLIFPKKYFGCLMAVFIEQKPITQDRIKQITNYSPTTISQMLKIIEVNFPLKQIKIPGDRKKYYILDISPRDFMVDFLLLVIDSYTERVDFVPPLIKELEPYCQYHVRFDIFKNYLTKMYDSSIKYMTLLSDTAEEFRNLMTTGQINDPELLDKDLFHSQRNLEAVQSSSSSIDHIENEELLEIYTQIKTKFYQQIKENLTGSQKTLIRIIIGTELLLEQRPITQQEIEKSTQLQRSTISDTLNSLLEREMIHLIKKPKDRKKYYEAIQSWETRMISRLKLNISFAIEMKEEMKTLMHSLNIENQDDKSLYTFLNQIYYSYAQLERYYTFLMSKYISIRKAT